jgi:transglutaminase-like putative cysteine protease
MSASPKTRLQRTSDPLDQSSRSRHAGEDTGNRTAPKHRPSPGVFTTGFLLVAVVFLTGGRRDLSSVAQGSANKATAGATNQREYRVEERLVLRNDGPGQPTKQNVWVALIRDFPPYQKVTSVVVSPEDYTVVVDEYGNHYAEFDFSNQPAGTTETVTIETQLVVNELNYDLSDCEGAPLEEFTQPELHIESANPQIVDLATNLAAGQASACQKVRAFYDYVSSHLTYTYNARNWGAQAALGPMGADCTEYASLLIALSRAQGIAARYFEGLRYVPEGEQVSARIEHAWPDVYLPGIGWVAMDPTLGRFLVDRDTYFAHYTPDHIIVTMGVNPSTLRGNSYWTYLYWPGDVAKINVESSEWQVDLVRGGS